MVLDDITRTVGLFVGTSAILYMVTKPKKDFEFERELNQVISFKGAMRYSKAAMRKRAILDEIDMY